MKKAISVLCVSLFLSSCGLMTSDEDKIKEAQNFLNSQQYSSSIVLLKGLLQDNGNNAQARFLLGKLYHEIGDYEGALKELSRAFSAGIKSQQVANLQLSSLLNLRSFDKMSTLLENENLTRLISAEDKLAYEGWVLLGGNRMAEAKVLFDKSLKTDAKNYNANLGLAQYYLGENNVQSALSQIDQSLSYVPSDPVLMLLKAKILASTKQNEASQALLEKVLQNEPNTVVTRRALEARLTLIRVLLVQKKEDEASRVIDDAYRASAQHPLIAYFKGYDLFRKKEYDKSREILLKVINNIPGHKPSLLLLGTISFEDNNFEQASLYLSGFLKDNIKHTPAIKMLGVSQLRLDQSDEALKTLKPVLEGGDFDVLKIAGAAAIASGDARKGAKFLESAIADNPDDLNIRIELAKAYLSMGEKSAAKKELESAILNEGKSGAKEDEATQAFSLLINLHMREKNYDLALSLAKKEAKKHKDSPLYPNVIGQIQARQKQLKKAEVSFKQSLTLDSKYWPAGLNLAKVYLVSKKLDKADTVYKDLLVREPKNESVLWDYSRYLISTKRGADAVTRLEKLISLNENNIQAARLLIQLFNQLGEKEKGEVVLANLSKTKRGKVFVQHMKGNAALQQGDAKVAIKTYEEIVAENPKSFVGYYDLAKAHLKNDDQASAKIALAKSLKIKKNFLPAVALDIKVDIVAKKFIAANKKIKKLIKQQPALALGYELKGDALLAQSKYAKAAKAYKTSSEFSDNIGIFLKYTRSLYRAGSSKTSRRVLISKLKKAKAGDRTAVQMELMRIYKKEGKTSKRIALLKTMASENKTNFGKLNDIAWLLHYDAPKPAEKYAAQAYKMKPEIGPINDTYGWILLKNGKLKKALGLLEEANKLSPNVPEIQFHLAVAQFKSKQFKEAKAAFEQLKTIKKKFEGKDDIDSYLQKIK